MVSVILALPARGGADTAKLQVGEAVHAVVHGVAVACSLVVPICDMIAPGMGGCARNGSGMPICV